MKTVLEETIRTIEVLKSEFIAIISHVESVDDIEGIVENIKGRYPRARHYCYAYKIGEKIRLNDDHEPSGTAGQPIFNAIINNDLDEVIIVVVRYFGGTLLGAGRLLRTYSDAAVAVAKDSTKYEIEDGFFYNIEISYDDSKKIKEMEKSFIVSLENIIYEATINLVIFSKEDIYNELVFFFKGGKVLKLDRKRHYKKIESVN